MGFTTFEAPHFDFSPTKRDQSQHAEYGGYWLAEKAAIPRMVRYAARGAVERAKIRGIIRNNLKCAR